MATFPEEALLIAVSLRTNGFAWPAIANHIEKNTTIRDPNGVPYHNAAIANAVLRDPRGLHLRVRAKNKPKLQKFKAKSKTKTSKSVPVAVFKRSPGRPTKVVSQITALSKAGFSTEQIIAILSMKK